MADPNSKNAPSSSSSSSAAAGGRAVEEGRGCVKAVPCGDTVTLLTHRGGAANSPLVEKEIILSGITAPRPGRPGGRDSKATEDEAFAHQAREFLRRLCIGKVVEYRVEYCIPTRSGDRTLNFGSIRVDGTDVNHAIVAAGWAKVKPAKENVKDEARAALIAVSADAESKQLGAFAPVTAAARRTLVSAPNVLEFISAYRGKTIDAVIETVREGALLSVGFSADATFYQVWLRLSGITSPGYRWDAVRREQIPEPFAVDARAFTERLLLHRDVSVAFEGVDKQNNFYGTVLWQGKNICEELLRNGLAQMVEWNCIAERKDAWRALERQAAAQRLRVWSLAQNTAAAAAATAGGAPPGSLAAVAARGAAAAAATGAAGAVGSARPASSSASSASSASASREAPVGVAKEFSGKVREITNGGGLVVEEVSAAGRKTRHAVALSSLQIPRVSMTGPAEAAKKESKDLGERERDDRWGLDAREYLRKLLIDKRVTCTLDYVRPGGADARTGGTLPAKAFHTVFYGDSNIATKLTENGLARVMSHRGADAARSPHYEALLQAEQRAQQASKGVHRKEPPNRRHINDVSRDAAKAKALFPFLQRAKRLQCIVEYVFSPTKVKLYCPREGFMFNFALVGVRGPSPADGIPEDVCERSLDFVRERVLQHDVDVEIESQDRGGNVVGDLQVRKKSIGIALLDEGLGYLHEGSAARSVHAGDLARAQEAAKKSDKGLWEHWNPREREEKAKAEAEEASEKAQPTKTVTVCEIVSGERFFVQLADEMAALDAMMKEINAEDVGALPVPAMIKKGTVLLAQFDADGRWYRVRCDGRDGGPGEYRVHYIDYGSSETTTTAFLRACDPKFLRLPAAARECALAYVKVPALAEEYGNDAAEYLKELVFEKRLQATIDYRDGTVTYVSLNEPETAQDVATALLSSGLARVDRRRVRSSQRAERLRETEDAARRRHLRIWQYGDVAEDEEDY